MFLPAQCRAQAKFGSIQKTEIRTLFHIVGPISDAVQLFCPRTAALHVRHTVPGVLRGTNLDEFGLDVPGSGGPAIASTFLSLPHQSIHPARSFPSNSARVYCGRSDVGDGVLSVPEMQDLFAHRHFGLSC